MKDAYAQFARDYDEFGSVSESPEDEKAFFESLFRRHGVQTVLDCACGTGRHLYLFSEMGLCVSGSDFSAPMLQVAQSNLQKHGKTIPLCQCDFRVLEQKHRGTFDAICCLTNSLPHLHTDADLLTALQSMKNRLNQSGLLILTQGTTHFTLSLPAIEVVVNRKDFSRIFVKEHDDRLQTIHVLDLFHSENRIGSHSYDMVYRILLDEAYQRLLSDAGFENIHIYGDYAMNDYTAKSKRLIVVAQRTD